MYDSVDIIHGKVETDYIFIVNISYLNFFNIKHTIYTDTYITLFKMNRIIKKINTQACTHIYLGQKLIKLNLKLFKT